MNKLLRSTWLPVVVSLGLFVSLYAATPSFTSFDQTYFTTNNLRVGFRSNGVPSIVVTNQTNIVLVSSNIYVTNLYATNLYVSNIISTDLLWTNDAAGLRPADHVVYNQIVVSNMHTYGWEGRDPEYVLVTSGSNTLDTTSFSSLLIFSEETNAASAIISLSPGAFNGQELELYNYTNSFWAGQFTLPANSQVLPFGGGYVKLRNNMDWATTNGSGLTLRYIAPDWIEMDRSYFGTTNQPQEIIINPTDGRLPYRVDADEFGDSPWHVLSALTPPLTNGIGFNSTNQFLWSGDSTKLALGYQAAGDRTIGSSSTALGSLAMQNSAGTYSTAVGYRSLISSANLYNSALGWQSGVTLQFGSYNTFAGADSGSGWTTGNYNTAIGAGSMNGGDFQNGRTAVGYYAMRAGGGGGGVAVGKEAGIASTAINTLIGEQAGYTLTSGVGNTLVGEQAGWTISGNKNVWVGDELQTGTSNGLDTERSVIVGYRRVPQGDPLTNITDSVFLGSITGLLTNSATKITNAITIGNNVLPTNSNEIVIGNSANTATYIPSLLGLGLGSSSTSQIIFGPGVTNVLARTNGTDLAYYAPAVIGQSSGLFINRGGGSTPAFFGNTTAGGAIVQSPSNRAILDVGGEQAYWDGSNFMPSGTGKSLGTAANPWTNVYLAADVFIRAGTGDPEGAVAAAVGSLFLRLDGGVGSTLYVKQSGTGNTGWAAK